ncbi:tail fiber protein [Stenotrophomonas pavanii]|jgi:microcystin-dependent protein|uniref:Phage tail protein n=2 Tax=Stenotrophomonas TaxID=40323 RepID=A0ABM7QZ79_9GAMM|nr:MULTISPECIES: tail fiber protein [Stenotrophomonas]TGR41982.1 phage tail protein [bacterium M00.F.Ca.ET.199.01.1.1]TGT03127.1 phage tail protein [bacterium M00.F.Ca.ET.177.01.1.1]TGT58062.1 phage tail protein [Mesorhizobium sp. M00.F.Ca.ET.170.01.1.1]TGU06976.1 phage tail protein [bacterium M00.F.Ca.ET.163.01.1.1]TGU91678.1 phage tail protein [Mesorhizobium sp. M00.F.Ca.ET.151.01.1.1]TGV53365.1 phage tail protein [bacterium M00.F.Ca.ET.141.01.1.1]
MSEPFLGQIMPVAFNFAPKNFAFCNGQSMSIQQNTALFSLLGTFYGGNGTTNFQLPDLRSRTPRGSTNGSNMGDRQGLESVTLLTSQIPQHAHVFGGTTADGSTRIPQGNVLLGKTGTQNVYGASSGAQVPLNVLDASGQTQPHANLQPYLVINFCIALYGIYPSRG